MFSDPALKDLWFTLAGANVFRDHLDAHDPKQKDDIKKILLFGLIVWFWKLFVQLQYLHYVFLLFSEILVNTYFS